MLAAHGGKAGDETWEVRGQKGLRALLEIDGHADRRLRVSVMAFEQVRHLLHDFASAGRVEVVSILEHRGRAYGASSAGDKSLPLDGSPRNAGTDYSLAKFYSCDGARDLAVEDRIARMSLVANIGKPAQIIYRSMGGADERMTAAFVFSTGLDSSNRRGPPESSGVFSIRSLAGCFVDVCLQYCLSFRQSISFFGFSGDLLARAACQIFVRNVTSESTGHDNGLVYGLCCDIADSHYEGRSGTGSFVFCRRDQDESVAAIKFRDPMSADQNFGARKLIEMTSDNFALLFDGGYFWGFASTPRTKHLPHVSFRGRGVWSIEVGDESLCLVSHGLPMSTARVLTERMFKQHLLECFPEISQAGAGRIWEIAKTAAAQPVGTNILFTPQAASETRRLSSQCIPIAPVRLTADTTIQLTAIDGTVIVDIEGSAHALGAIMDGCSTPNGAWQRGGRYNSAANYVSSANFPAMIFIVSQDGYVDIVPPIGGKGQKWTQRRYLKLSSTAT